MEQTPKRRRKKKRAGPGVFFPFQCQPEPGRPFPCRRRRIQLNQLPRFFLVLAALVFAKDLWACPAGQTCSVAGSDCADTPELCVADTSSSDSGGSSTAPTATDDQLGLTHTPDDSYESPFLWSRPGYVEPMPWDLIVDPNEMLPEVQAGMGIAGEMGEAADAYIQDMFQGLTNFPSYQMPSHSADVQNADFPVDLTVL